MGGVVLQLWFPHTAPLRPRHHDGRGEQARGGGGAGEIVWRELSNYHNKAKKHTTA